MEQPQDPLAAVIHPAAPSVDSDHLIVPMVVGSPEVAAALTSGPATGFPSLWQAATDATTAQWRLAKAEVRARWRHEPDGVSLREGLAIVLEILHR